MLHLTVFLLVLQQALWDPRMSWNTEGCLLPWGYLHLLSGKCSQQAEILFNTRAESRQLTPSINHYAPMMHLCECAIYLSQMLISSNPIFITILCQFFWPEGTPNYCSLKSWICRFLLPAQNSVPTSAAFLIWIPLNTKPGHWLWCWILLETSPVLSWRQAEVSFVPWTLINNSILQVSL